MSVRSREREEKSSRGCGRNLQEGSEERRSPRSELNFFGGLARLCGEPSLRYTEDGRAWCTARLGFRSLKEKEYLYFDCVAFGVVAERLGMLRRGDTFFVRDASMQKKRGRDDVEIVVFDADFFEDEGTGEQVVEDTFRDDGGEPVGDLTDIPF